MADVGGLGGRGVSADAAPTIDKSLENAFAGVMTDALAHCDDYTKHEILRGVLKRRRKDNKHCVRLPFSILFFLVYALSMQMHNDITVCYRMQSMLRRRVDNGLDGVETVEDITQWLRYDFVDFVFVQKDQYGDELPQNEWNRVMKYNQVQGSVVVTQSRSLPAGETWGIPLQKPLDNFTATLQETNFGFVATGSDDSHARRLEPMRVELETKLMNAWNLAGEQSVYDVVISPAQRTEDVILQFDYLDKRGWIDENTRFLNVKMLLLNAELGRPVLMAFDVWLVFSPGGGVYYKTQINSHFLEAQTSVFGVLIDVVWVLLLLCTTLLFLRSIWTWISHGQLLQHIFRAHFIVPLVISIGGWALVAIFVRLHFYSIADIADRLWTLRRVVKWQASQGLNNTPEVDEASEQLHKATADAQGPLMLFDTACTWYTLVLMLQFFHGFNAQPRLAVVTNTLRATFVDVIHFFIVFTPTFVAYVISGNILFGRRMEEFSTIATSVGTCFRMVMENEYDWEVLSAEYYYTALFWTWSFLVVVVLIMLNMVLAIVLDIYNEVRENVDSADTIFLFVGNLAKRVWNGRKWVPDAKLDALINSLEGSGTISKKDIFDMIPGITNAQADMLFKACQSTTAFEAKRHMKRGVLLQLSTSIKLGIDRAQILLRQMKKNQRNPKTEKSRRPSKGRAPSKDAPGDKRSKSQIQLPIPAAGQPTTFDKRRTGRSRPYPGAPQVPGSCWVPLLPPEQASNEQPDKSSRPAWLNEVDDLLDKHEAELRKLQELVLDRHEKLFASSQRLLVQYKRVEQEQDSWQNEGEDNLDMLESHRSSRCISDDLDMQDTHRISRFTTSEQRSPTINKMNIV